MAVDLVAEGAGEGPSAERRALADPAPACRWAFEEEFDAVRVELWGSVGPRETAALDERLLRLRERTAPLVIDLTGVSDLHEETVTWLGLRHAAFGRERPMLVCVVADGSVHLRLTRADAPQLRLTLK
ncbi:MAG: hypothetical protein H0V81_15730 [Solirubrobacterales bacterium]|nr:hypothetical protein [Solirubrobacterales bacterium]